MKENENQEEEVKEIVQGEGMTDKVDKVIEEEGSPPLLGSGGSGPHASVGGGGGRRFKHSVSERMPSRASCYLSKQTQVPLQQNTAQLRLL